MNLGKRFLNKQMGDLNIMKANKILFSLLAMNVCFISVGCDKKDSSKGSSSRPIDFEHYYETVEQRAAFDNENTKNFNQTFQNGLDDNLFYALEGAWHTNVQGAEHGGMKHRNLFYASDGTDSYLAIKARGYYSKEDPTTIGLPEGGCIVSKKDMKLKWRLCLVKEELVQCGLIVL